MKARLEAVRVRAALDGMGARALAEALGIVRYRPEQGGRAIRAACPVHGGDNPQAFALGARRGEHTLAWHCHTACARGGDALSLVAEVHGLDVQRDFGAVLERAAAIAGVGPEALAPSAVPRAAPRRCEPEAPLYPDRDDVLAVWDAGRTMRRGQRRPLPPEVARWLTSRRLDGGRLHDRGLVVGLERDPDLPGGHPLPTWARRWWWRGYRAILPLYDANGVMRSLRARLVRPATDDAPKALAPAGFGVTGLVLATLPAVQWLRGHDTIAGLVVVEGETDFLTAATAWPSCAVVGLVAGASWTATFAAKVPEGARVLLATDGDEPGERYAASIAHSLGGRCDLRRRAGI